MSLELGARLCLGMEVQESSAKKMVFKTKGIRADRKVEHCFSTVTFVVMRRNQ